MDQTVKTFTSEGADARKWIGRIIMAVILGEAIWNLIVSVMNNLVVPFTPPVPVTVPPAAPFVALRPVARAVAVAPPAPPVANSVAVKPLPSAPKAAPPKLKKPKEVYYNIVGEPVPSDED
jgi:hypothetical protein